MTIHFVDELGSKSKPLIFQDHPEFKPTLTPRQIFELGSFGGTYWRPIHSRVTGKNYKNEHKKFPFLKDLPDSIMTKPYNEYDKSLNRYGVKVGTTLEYWEDKGWIRLDSSGKCPDPYGFIQWYSNFYSGRRIPDEDARQIKRWQAMTRFSKRLENLQKQGKDSPAIRQTLQHWGIAS